MRLAFLALKQISFFSVTSTIPTFESISRIDFGEGVGEMFEVNERIGAVTSTEFSLIAIFLVLS